MDSYVIEKFDGNYSYIIVNLSYMGIHFDMLELDIYDKLNGKGKILVDNFLHSGNNSDRFIEFEFDNGSMLRNTFKFIPIKKDSAIRRKCSSLLLRYPEAIENSILNSVQKDMLLKGLSI